MPLSPRPMFLTDHERTVFELLPADLRRGWRVAAEPATFEDSDEKREVRMRNMRLKSPELLGLKQSAGEIKTAEDVARVIQETDVSRLQKSDLAELFFALGPDALTAMIGNLLAEATAQDDLAAASYLSTVRHSLLASLA